MDGLCLWEGSVGNIQLWGCEATWEADAVGLGSATRLVFQNCFPLPSTSCLTIPHPMQSSLRDLLIQVWTMMALVLKRKSNWRVGWEEKGRKGFSS